jgi:DNA-binding NtrC family response regulator
MKKKGHILIVDDDPDVLFTAKTILKREYEYVTTESSPNRLETLIKKENIDLVILDMNFKAGVTSGNEGLFWLRRIKELDPGIHVLMNTAYGDIQLAVESMKLGAVDFLVKPWEKETLLATTHTVFELRKSQKKVAKLEGREQALSQDLDQSLGDLIYKSSSMEQVMESVKRVALTDASVLILGENGTGKELIARAIHKLSPRSNESLIKVDLGAITESLFESEIFGHVKGAFTDAREDRAGRFEIADGGSIFLDEIGNLSVPMQAKLLSVLQNRSVNRVGSAKAIPFDVRLISATNMPLYEMVNEGNFRQDLLYRINTVEITIPPLRHRPEDIRALTQHYLDQYKVKYQKPGMKLLSGTMNDLVKYSWPGNIRELQHAVERAVIMSGNHELTTEDFLLKKPIEKKDEQSLNLDDLERNAISKAIDQSDGNLSQAASILGMGRTTLYRKMKKYGLNG